MYGNNGCLENIHVDNCKDDVAQFATFSCRFSGVTVYIKGRETAFSDLFVVLEMVMCLCT